MPPWNLPKSWSPGFALPSYVEAEGLERHAFVTQQAPRGTYDNPSLKDFNTGYAIPQYVQDEGYGHGVYVTKQAPRGTYYGPRIPHWLDKPPNQIVAERKARGGGTAFTIQPLSGAGATGGLSETPLPAGYQRYGDRTSAVIIAGVKKLPPNRRKKALEHVLNQIDPSLWGRTSSISKRYEQAGMASDLALEHGLSRAMGAGLLGEVLHAGQTGKVGTDKGHLAIVKKTRMGDGLGCMPMSALSGLGALTVDSNHTVAPSGVNRLRVQNTTTVTPTKMVQVGPFQFPADAETYCINLVLPGEFTTEKKMSLFPPGISTVTRVSSSPDGGGTKGTTGCLDVVMGSAAQKGLFPDAAQQKIVEIISKDCSFNVGALAATAVMGALTAPLAAVSGILAAVRLPVGFTGFASSKPCITSSMADAGYDNLYGFLQKFMPGATVPSRINQDYVYLEGYTIGKGGTNPMTNRWNGGSPIIVTSNPVNGKDYGIFLSLGPANGTDNVSVPWGGPGNPVHLTITWKPMPDKDWPDKLIAWVMHIGAEIIDIAGDVLDFIGDEACQLLSSQAGAVGAVAGGAAVGGTAGVQAGAAGANVAKAVCGNVPPPLIAPQGPSLILPLALLGVGGLFVLVAAKKKRKKAV